MKKFEVGKCYERTSIFGHFFETWQCTKINNERATFKLVGFTYSEDGGKSYKEAYDFLPQRVYFDIKYAKWLDSEIASNCNQPFSLRACDEI